ncbi:GRB10-interacting GYF protein 2-like [Teleopsis dalmanni]|uniref:GRB10-interacting GYF protein 2-like n=2 Tax=Teleopsis dalmanni TaxID=139649 RepID=UPI0018CD90B2|nr:GRB10-interacting GYF protein 2-like [Teleopsis dalmanni]
MVKINYTAAILGALKKEEILKIGLKEADQDIFERIIENINTQLSATAALIAEKKQPTASCYYRRREKNRQRQEENLRRQEENRRRQEESLRRQNENRRRQEENRRRQKENNEKKPKESILEIIQEAKSISLTTDMWASSANKSYLAVTAHFISQNWEFNSCLLSCVECGFKLTSENLAAEIKRIIDEWRLTDQIFAVATDNAANIMRAVT